MKSHEVLKRACKKMGAKNVAAHLNLSLATVHQWSRPPKPKGTGIINPLDRIAAILDFTGEKQLAEWICRRAGGYFVHNPAVKNGRPKPLSAAESAVVHDFAQMIQLLSKAGRDNSISPEESAHIRERWDKLKSVTEGFVSDCEKGNFHTNFANGHEFIKGGARTVAVCQDLANR